MLETPFVAEQYVLLLEECSPKNSPIRENTALTPSCGSMERTDPHWLQSNRRLGLLQTGLQCLSDHCNSSHQILHVILFFSSFIHSGYFYSTSSKSTTTQRRCRHSTDTVSEFHAEAPQALSKGGLRWTGEGGQAQCGRPHRKLKLESTDVILFFSCKEVGVFFTRISSLDRINSGNLLAI